MCVQYVCVYIMLCPFDLKCSSVFDKVNVGKAVVFIMIKKNYNYNF